MESLVGEMAVLLQEIRQRERAGSLDLDATNALQEALRAACATCDEVLHPAPPVEEQPPQKASGAKAKK